MHLYTGRARACVFFFPGSGTEKQPRLFRDRNKLARAQGLFSGHTARPGEHERVARMYTDATILFGGWEGGENGVTKLPGVDCGSEFTKLFLFLPSFHFAYVLMKGAPNRPTSNVVLDRKCALLMARTGSTPFWSCR